ncbi:hypothetical protein CANINC_004798 [Pichia inconspicua]|uniref:Maintenance of mitochondrial morphology protein 1 n=1 Tax=Pichia inconspicua TaxID=52247 RepID=A0A4T0WV50_9ASCO|nr:hypothetical protein CANINC_004798 [[Candida] inconspicua]
MTEGECSTAENVIGTSCHVDETSETGSAIQKTQSTTSENIQTEQANYTELERYLTGILNGLQKQQENQKSDLLQMILHQNLNYADALAPAIQTIPTQNSPSSSAWVFTQGLVIGQLSVIILIVAFIRFFVFTEAVPTQARPILSKRTVIKTKNKEGLELSSLPLSRITTDANAETMDDLNHQTEIDRALGAENSNLNFNKTLNSILEKTYYDVKTHKPESLDWFNVLVAQIISQARLEALNDGNIYESLNKALNSPPVLQYFDAIKITEINIGDDYPIFSNCRVKNNDGRLEAKIDVDVSDTITIGVETNLLVNQPKFMSASLPIKLSISIVRFSACLSVSLISTDDNGDDDDNDDVAENDQSNNDNGNLNYDFTNRGAKPEKATKEGNGKKSRQAIALMFSFSPDFRLEFEIKSLIGSKAKLENIPRISSILENIIRKWFIERCIEPRFQLIKLPSMWPRSKNTRESKSQD